MHDKCRSLKADETLNKLRSISSHEQVKHASSVYFGIDFSSKSYNITFEDIVLISGVVSTLCKNRSPA